MTIFGSESRGPGSPARAAESPLTGKQGASPSKDLKVKGILTVNSPRNKQIMIKKMPVQMASDDRKVMLKGKMQLGLKNN